MRPQSGVSVAENIHHHLHTSSVHKASMASFSWTLQVSPRISELQMMQVADLARYKSVAIRSKSAEMNLAVTECDFPSSTEHVHQQ